MSTLKALSGYVLADHPSVIGFITKTKVAHPINPYDKMSYALFERAVRPAILPKLSIFQEADHTFKHGVTN